MTDPIEVLDESEEEIHRPRTFWTDAWEELKGRFLFWFSLGLIVIFTLMAIFPAAFVAPSPGPDDPSGEFCILRESRETPSSEAWFGKDTLGCDYYAQVTYGARVSMRVALGVTIVSLVIGVALGAIAGFFGGFPDSFISRIADGFFALPYLVGAIIILSALGGDGRRTEFDVLMAIAFLGWPAVMRLFRSTVLQVRGLEYVDAARAMGASNWRIITRHILPNAIAPVLIYMTVSMGAVIAVEATLSFFGVGLPINSISWGIMVNEAQTRMQQAPHLLIFPSIYLGLASLGFVMLGEQLREAFDPKLRI